jgi:hypothetical protein
MVFSLYIAKWLAIKKDNLPYSQSGCHFAKCDAEHEVKEIHWILDEQQHHHQQQLSTLELY